MRLPSIALVAISLAIVCPASGDVCLFTITDLGTLGGTVSRAYGINEAGQVTGSSNNRAFLYDGTTMNDLGTIVGRRYSYGSAINGSGKVVGSTVDDSTSFLYAFIHDGTMMTDLGTLGGAQSQAKDINDAGQVVGSAQDSASNYRAFLYDGSNMNDLGTLGGTVSGGEGINDVGHVVGASLNSSGNFHAFLYDGATMADLGTLPGGTQSIAYDINGVDHVAGSSRIANGNVHAFSYDGALHDLGTLGGAWSESYAINDAEQVVGWSHASAGDNRHAFLYDSAVMHDLNDLINPASGWTLEFAGDINNSGQITGYGTIGGQTHAYLLTPIRENLPGDADVDGAVDVIDLGILATYYNTAGSHVWEHGDFNGDGHVDAIDLGILSNNYGNSSSAAAIPEPATLVLMGICMVGFLAWTRRSRHLLH